MNIETMDTEEIDLKELLYIFRLRWKLVALMMILALAVSGFVSFRVLKPIYKAEATLFVGRESGSQIAGIDLSQFSLEQKLVVDYREIILSRLVAREVIDTLDLDMGISSFQNRIKVTTVRESRLFKIAFESTEPALARDVANLLSEVIIVKAQDIMDVKNIQIIDRAEIPKNPIRPNKTMNLAIAGVLGLMIGCFMVFLLEYLNQTIKSAKDVERHLHLTTLGEIPAFEGEERGKKKGPINPLRLKQNGRGKRLKQSDNLIAQSDPKAPASEAYRSLRTNIGYLGIDQKIKVIPLTSASPTEGKSTTCANLAISMAQAGKKVLLVEADLRKPKVHHYFNVPNDVGLVQILLDELPYERAIKKATDQPNLDLICAGFIPPNPAEILGSKKMSQLIETLRPLYDLIILDTPPVGQLTDAAIIGKMADGMILVVASGETNIDLAKFAKTNLLQAGVNILGVVLTKIDKKSGGAYYYRYYQYDQYYYKEG